MIRLKKVKKKLAPRGKKNTMKDMKNISFANAIWREGKYYIAQSLDVDVSSLGVQVTAVEIKDVTLPDNMQRAMAKEAEAVRERRAKIVAAEGEFQASQKLGEAADIIASHPVALQLRTLQTMAEIATEKNSTIIFPAQFMTTVKEAMETLRQDGKAE